MIYFPVAAAVGNNRQIYAHYHHLKKAYDVLKIPALRNKYNQYGFEGLSNLKYAQAKVTNRYAPNLSEGWDPDGPTSSKVPIGIGARVLNNFCAPNIAAMSFESSGVEYKSLGELGAIVATHPGSVDWVEDSCHDDMGTVLTGAGGSMLGTASSSSASQKPKKRQKFFTIAPLPIGTHFQAAGPIPLEDLFEMELENSDGSDDELFLKEASSPIIAGPVGGTVQFMPLSDLKPIRFQDGASVSMNGQGGLGVAVGRGQTVHVAPLLSDRVPIQFQNGASVSLGGTDMKGGLPYNPSSSSSSSSQPPKRSTKSNGDKPIPWPLSNIDAPVLSSIGADPTKPVPSGTGSTSSSSKQRRQKFFTIPPLALGKAYQRAPKLSVDQLFEDCELLDRDTIGSSSSIEMETTDDNCHSMSTFPIPFPTLDSIPSPSHAASLGSKSADSVSPLHPSMGAVVATSPGTLYKGTAAPRPESTTTTTTIRLRNIPSQSSKSPKSMETIRLYTIRPLPVGQAYTRAPSVDRATLFGAVGHVGEEHVDDNNDVSNRVEYHDNAACIVVPTPSSMELEKTTSHPLAGTGRTTPASRRMESHPTKRDEAHPTTVVDYGSLLQQASTTSTAAAAAAAPPDIFPLGSIPQGGTNGEQKSASHPQSMTVPTRLMQMSMAARGLAGQSHAPGRRDPTFTTVRPIPSRRSTAMKNSVFHPPMFPLRPTQPRTTATAATTRKAVTPTSTTSGTTMTRMARHGNNSSRHNDGTLTPATAPATIVAGSLKSHQDSTSWWKEAQGRLTVAEPLPASLFFSKQATHWNRHNPSS